MSTPPSTMKDLAGQLLSFEMATTNSSDCFAHAVKVCEKLKIPFSKLAGGDGFASFLSRALALAKLEVPSLSELEMQADGSLKINPKSEHDSQVDSAAGAALVTQLLLLLVTFIGERLTVTLVLEAWPEGSAHITHLYSEAKA